MRRYAEDLKAVDFVGFKSYINSHVPDAKSAGFERFRECFPVPTRYQNTPQCILDSFVIYFNVGIAKFYQISYCEDLRTGNLTGEHACTGTHGANCANIKC